MITALLPAHYQGIAVEEENLRPRGFSDDARLMEHVSLDTVCHLLSTPGNCVAAEESDDYEIPPPQSVATKKVHFRNLGPGQPLRLDEDIDDQLPRF